MESEWKIMEVFFTQYKIYIFIRFALSLTEGGTSEPHCFFLFVQNRVGEVISVI